MPGRYGRLTGEQAEHFRQRGFVTVRGAFDAASAQRWLDDAWIRFGYDRNDPGSWAENRIHLSARSHVDARAFAPAAWNAAVELAGGEERVVLPWRWGDSFIANLGVGDDRRWQPPSPAAITGVSYFRPDRRPTWRTTEVLDPSLPADLKASGRVTRVKKRKVYWREPLMPPTLWAGEGWE